MGASRAAEARGLTWSCTTAALLLLPLVLATLLPDATLLWLVPLLLLSTSCPRSQASTTASGCGPQYGASTAPGTSGTSLGMSSSGALPPLGMKATLDAALAWRVAAWCAARAVRRRGAGLLAARQNEPESTKILTGIKEGERVATSNLADLYDGAEVRASGAAGAAPAPGAGSRSGK